MLHPSQLKQLPAISRQAGVTLIELTVVVIIISILSFGLYKVFGGATEGSRARSLNLVMSQTAGALDRFKADTGCYPNRMDALEKDINKMPDNITTGTSKTWTYKKVVYTRSITAEVETIVRLPTGTERQATKVEVTKTDFDVVQNALNEAKTASAAGNVEEAVGKAKAGEEQAKLIMTALGMTSI